MENYLNKHLSNIIQQYLNKERVFHVELLTKTKHLLDCNNMYYFYDKYSVYQENFFRSGWNPPCEIKYNKNFINWVIKYK
jgi:hypothetical protein